MHTGLYLGKFAPLHKGHQYMIEQALQQVDKLVCIVYDAPSTIAVPLSVRAQWVRDLYPDVDVLEGWLGPEECGYTPEIMRMQQAYVLKLLDGSAIDAFFSSEPYGEHMSKALGAKNCVIDIDRTAVPISATQVRTDPFEARTFLDPLVYKDLVTHVVLMGAPSTGKTTLATALAKKFETVWMPEYGREYWATHQVERRLTLEQLYEIGIGHREREDVALWHAREYLFTDTNAITTRIFSQYYHGKVDPRLEALAEQCSARYDLVIVCEPDIPYDDTEDRSGEGQRAEFHKRTLAYLHEHKIPYVTVRGSVDERVEQVDKVLERFKKYTNCFSL